MQISPPFLSGCPKFCGAVPILLWASKQVKKEDTQKKEGALYRQCHRRTETSIVRGAFVCLFPWKCSKSSKHSLIIFWNTFRCLFPGTGVTKKVASCVHVLWAWHGTYCMAHHRHAMSNLTARNNSVRTEQLCMHHDSQDNIRKFTLKRLENFCPGGMCRTSVCFSRPVLPADFRHLLISTWYVSVDVGVSVSECMSECIINESRSLTSGDMCVHVCVCACVCVCVFVWNNAKL